MTTTIGFISEKGGVGKTTACYHVGVGLTRFHNKSVLIIDADYQRGGITGRLFPSLLTGFRAGTLPDITIFHRYQQLYSGQMGKPVVTIRTAPIGVDAIVADTRLASVTTDKLPSTNNIKENNLSLLRHMQAIKDVIDETNGKYDYVLIDSHPEISDVLRSIIYASDHCVSPVKLDLQSSIGVPTIVSEIGVVNGDVALLKSSIAPTLNHAPTNFAGAIGMMAREYGGVPKETERTELRRLSSAGPVFTNYTTEGDGLRQAAQQRVPVYDISGANANKQSAQLRLLTREIIQQCP